MRLNLEHGAWIAELLSAVDIVWATGWNDDLHTEAAREWAAGRPFATLLITADPAVGLTRDAVRRVLGWAAAL